MTRPGLLLELAAVTSLVLLPVFSLRAEVKSGALSTAEHAALVAELDAKVK